jgi:hypothetical protein
MKLQINTEEKTIIFEESIELDKLVKWMQATFPNGEWKKYKLEPKVISLWNNPAYVPWYLPFTFEMPKVVPAHWPTITCDVPNTQMPCSPIYNICLSN